MRFQRELPEAVRTTSLTDSTVTGRSCQQTRSTTEPLGTGTLRAWPVSLPLSSGSRPMMISAELVSCGMMFSPAARPRRGSSAGTCQPLLVAEGVDGAQEGPLDAEGVVEDLEQRRR